LVVKSSILELLPLFRIFKAAEGTLLIGSLLIEILPEPVSSSLNRVARGISFKKLAAIMAAMQSNRTVVRLSWVAVVKESLNPPKMRWAASPPTICTISLCCESLMSTCGSVTNANP
jgi:hypothetical protein